MATPFDGTTVLYMKKELEDIEDIVVKTMGQPWGGRSTVLNTIKEENLPVLLPGDLKCLEDPIVKLEAVNPPFLASASLNTEPVDFSLLDNPLSEHEDEEMDDSMLKLDFGLPNDPSYEEAGLKLNILDESLLKIEGVDFSLPDNPLFEDLQPELSCGVFEFDQSLSSNSAANNETDSLETPPILSLALNSFLNEEIFQRDIILAHHPLLPHLQALLQGTTLPLHQDTPLSGVGEADDVLQEAIKLMLVSVLPRGNKAFEGIAQSFLDETTGFCQGLLNDDETGFSENDANATNRRGVERSSTPRPLVNTIKSSVTGTKRSKPSKKTSKILREWLFEHPHHPYPNDDEKDELCLRTNLTIPQLNNWFINARRRILQPYLRRSLVHCNT